MLLCPPRPPLHLKLGLVKLLVGLLFDCFPAVEGILTAELGIFRKEYHGGSFEGRQCSRIISIIVVDPKEKMARWPKTNNGDKNLYWKRYRLERVNA